MSSASPSHRFTAAVLLQLLATIVVAANTQKTWAAVSFVYHGEKQPMTGALTTTGAHQLYDAGAVIRARYMGSSSSADENATATTVTQSNPINGLSASAIDNQQLYLLSRNDDYVAASAQAFMQGLYPPTAVRGQGSQVLADGSLLSFPLDGYQYASIGTVSVLDFNSIWIAGNLGCTNYEAMQYQYLGSEHYMQMFQESNDFYTSLESSVFSTLDPSIVNYANAYQLYEYALYETNHNSSVASTLTDSEVRTLQKYASEEQFTLNSGNASQINTLAGSTLAAKMVEMLSRNIESGGVSDKLSFFFGSFEPLLSFFSLSGLSDSYQSNSRFQNLPLHGSVMSFELFSFSDTTADVDFNSSAPYPAPDELYVRFLFRNGTAADEPLLSYPLFGRGNSDADMSWRDFLQGMSSFAMYDAADWCTACETVNLFCQAVSNSSSVSSPSSSLAPAGTRGMKPWVAGIIGAAVTLAIAVVAIALLALLGGARLSFRHGSSSSNERGSSTLGGFKGAEKMKSDPDLAVSGSSLNKSGGGASVVTRHERVGSWELHDRDDKTPTAALDRVVSGHGRVEMQRPRRSLDSEDDRVDPFGDPVKAVDQV
ncbi:histidine acid phosphatase [Phlyctema vagabunda]|uniref:Histidine acid phosphatase n=1 Tax=Phlyctema vagabunda TaxID=108571 RepID=A0ABR4PE36_9HELO